MRRAILAVLPLLFAGAALAQAPGECLDKKGCPDTESHAKPYEPKAQQSLPQKPIAAAAVILEIYFHWNGMVAIEVVDDDQAHLRALPKSSRHYLTFGELNPNSDIHIRRFDDCVFRLSDYSDGFVAELNFGQLSDEYETHYTDDGRYIVMSIKGKYEQGKNGPICKGHLPLSDIRRSQSDRAMHPQFNQDIKCFSNVDIGLLTLDGVRHVERALRVISESCPLDRLPF